MPKPENTKIGTVVAIAVTTLCALVTVGTEYAGALKLQIGTFALALLPLFFAFVITVAVNLSLSWRRPDAGPLIWSCAGRLLQLLTVVFVVRAGVVLGGALPTIVEAGPAILVQGFGKAGTALLAFPAGSVARLRTREYRRHLLHRPGTQHRPGDRTVRHLRAGRFRRSRHLHLRHTLRSLFFSALAGIGSAIPLFDSTAPAMACGVGSGGMTISCAGSLTHGSRDLPQDEILALATASDVLTYVTTVLLGAFIVLPVLERLHRSPTAVRSRLGSEDTVEAKPTFAPSRLVAGLAVTVLLVVTLGWRAVPGLFVLLALAFGAQILGTGPAGSCRRCCGQRSSVPH